MNKKHFTAIVLSAGKGNRMHSDIPKQYMDMQGYPVIYYALKAFEESKVDDIILVTGAEDVAFCTKDIVQKYHFTKVKDVVPGGAERYLSVLEGLKKAQNADYVLIHDGARPMIGTEDIEKSMQMVEQEEACVLATPVKDTIKVVTKGYVTDTPDRDTLWAMQTPQSFSTELLRNAYIQLETKQKKGEKVPNITDDAMIVEYMTGHKIRIIPGNYANIKITTPEDLVIAEMFLKKMKNNG